MKKTRKILKILTIIILIFLGYANQETIIEKSQEILNPENHLSKTNDFKLENQEIIYNLEENLTNDLEIVFCPSQNCFDIYNTTISNAKEEIKCAFYELDEMNLAKTILKKANENINVSLIIDDKYLDEKPLQILYNTSINIFSDAQRETKYNNYMHDKFCVIDNQILITGSTNPTENGFFKNNNNILKIQSKYLSQNYENEFDQMASVKYGSSKKSVLEYNNITFNFENDSYLISSYMCPKDNCANNIINILDKAQTEILFATFSFTHNDIETKLVEKYNTGIKVEGIIENRNANGQSSVFKDVVGEFKIQKDTNPATMHHKFFIVDSKWVITSSMNPSNNGNKYNDENILIIESEKIAKMYEQEYFGIVE